MSDPAAGCPLPVAQQMFRARCNRCRWLFDVVALPAAVEIVASVCASTACPLCGNRDGNRIGDSRPLTPEETAHLAQLERDKV